MVLITLLLKQLLSQIFRHMKQKKINFLDNDKYSFIRFIFFGMQVFKNFRGKNLKLIILKKYRIKSKKII